MIFQILSYFRFLLSSTNQHGVHSPFVFNLVTKCFYDKSKYDGYIKLKEYRDILYKNSNTINVVDFGSGSRIFKTNTRKISSLAKHAGTSKKRTQLLYRLVTHLNVTSILELGTSLGIGSSAMAINHPNTSILTIEGCPETAKFTQEMFNKFELTNITLKNEEFNSTLHKLKTKEKYDLIYIDGNHNKKATLEYFELIKITEERKKISKNIVIMTPA